MRPMHRTAVFSLAVALVTAIGACGSVTDPNARSADCAYPGDTIGYGPLIQVADSLILSCIWLTETKTRCYLSPVTLYGTKDCVPGEKWKGTG